MKFKCVIMCDNNEYEIAVMSTYVSQNPLQRNFF